MVNQRFKEIVRDHNTWHENVLLYLRAIAYNFWNYYILLNIRKMSQNLLGNIRQTLVSKMFMVKI